MATHTDPENETAVIETEAKAEKPKRAPRKKAAPKEQEDDGGSGYTLYVDDPGPAETERVVKIARAADPSVELRRP